MTDPDDDYPPYATAYREYVTNQDRRIEAQRHIWREVAIVTACGILAALAIGGLLVAYGVF